MTDEPMTVASRSVTLRDFAIFQMKLFLDGMKDFVAIWLSTGAIILDFIAGRGKKPRLFYSVVPASASTSGSTSTASCSAWRRQGRTTDCSGPVPRATTL